MRVDTKFTRFCGFDSLNNLRHGDNDNERFLHERYDGLIMLELPLFFSHAILSCKGLDE